MPVAPRELLRIASESPLAKTKPVFFDFLDNLQLRERMRSKYNTAINWGATVNNATVTREVTTAIGSLDNSPDNVPATLNIGNYRIRHKVRFNQIQVEEAADAGDGELEDIVAFDILDAVDQIRADLNLLCLAGTGSVADIGISGLRAIADNTQPYANISPVTYSAWTSTLLANAGTARNLTKDLLNKVDELSKRKKVAYDMIVCAPETATSYQKLFDASNSAGQATYVSDGGKFKPVDLGHGSRHYNGRPIIEDPNCPLGQLYFLQSSDATVYTFDFKNRNGRQMTLQEDDNRAVNIGGLNYHIKQLGIVNGALREFEIYVIPQFKIHNRKSLIALTDIIV